MVYRGYGWNVSNREVGRGKEMSYNRLAEAVFMLRPAGPLADLARTIDESQWHGRVSGLSVNCVLVACWDGRIPRIPARPLG